MNTEILGHDQKKNLMNSGENPHLDRRTTSGEELKDKQLSKIEKTVAEQQKK